MVILPQKGSIRYFVNRSSIMRKYVYKPGRTLSAQGQVKPALDYLIAEGRVSVKGSEAACEALDASSGFCY